VQVGFGRLGTHFWGFETQGVVPDIVVFWQTDWKCISVGSSGNDTRNRGVLQKWNGIFQHVRRESGFLARLAWRYSMWYRKKKLQQNALQVGSGWIAALTELQQRFPVIGDVARLGPVPRLDLVLSCESRAPAPQQASYVVNRLREEGILAGTDGPHHKCDQAASPLIFSERDAGIFCQTLETILREDAAQV